MFAFSRFAVALIALLFATMAKAEPWDEAWAAYQRGDFQAAIEIMLPLAEAGHVEAQDRLAHIYWFGEGTPVDYAQALKWSRRSAAQGSYKGMNDLGVHYEHGHGVERDVQEAIRWYEKAVAAGDEGRSLRNIADVLARGAEGIEKDESEALRLYRLAAKLGDPGAHFELARKMIAGELGLERDLSEAARLLRIAARQHLSQAQSLLAHFHAFGVVVAPDPVAAVMWYHLSIQHGCPAPLSADVAADFTRGQIAAGIALAEQWLRENPPPDVHPHPRPFELDCGEPIDPMEAEPGPADT